MKERPTTHGLGSAWSVIFAVAMIGILVLGAFAGAVYQNQGGNTGSTGKNSVEATTKSAQSSSPEIKLTPHDPIHITSNADFASQASANGWPGDGTQGNPYIIDGYEIDGQGSSYCIWIENTVVWFVIRNCKLWDATDYSIEPSGTGIYLKNVQHGTLVNNNCSGNSCRGIYLYYSSDNNITNNNCSGNFNNGIMLWGSSNNTILNNICSGNWNGICLVSSRNNNITNNNCSGNSNNGIVLVGSSNNNNITNNDCPSNSYGGIYLEVSSSNNITNNNCSGNYYGTYLEDSSSNNITNNNCSGNYYGTYLEDSSSNNITNNNCSGNYYGTYLNSSSTNNITYNNFYHNTNYAVYITHGSTGNTIHHNNFWQNNGAGRGVNGNCQAYDSPGGNIWYDNVTKEGNYWSNWDGCGPAYPIDGRAGAYDIHPLKEPVNILPVPSAPQNLTAVAGDGKVTLSWQSPARDGGSPITNYKIYRNGTLLATIGTNTSYVDYNVVNCVTYTYKVSAVNSAGEGPFSNEVTAIPYTVPSAPQNLVATAGNQEVSLSWQPPADNGGSPITGYKIYYGTSTDNYTKNITVGNVTRYTITGLTNGQEYYFVVSAINGVGEGPKSNEASATPVGEQQHGNTPGFDILVGICAIAGSMAVIAIRRRSR
jgi:parallel beta-helix repeat protein